MAMLSSWLAMKKSRSLWALARLMYVIEGRANKRWVERDEAEIQGYLDEINRKVLDYGNGAFSNWDRMSNVINREFNLGFCDCGTGNQFKHLLGALSLLRIERRITNPWVESQSSAEQDLEIYKAARRRWSDLCLAYFGNSGAMTFFWHWAAEKELTEHGGSVPGWLTPKGIACHEACGILMNETSTDILTLY